MFPSFLWRLLFPSDASADWGSTVEAAEPGEVERVAEERVLADSVVDTAKVYPQIDLEKRAATCKYPHNGKVKRTRYRRVNLAKRIVVIMVHQMGVERGESSRRWHRTTCHRCIGPSGNRYRVHPLDVRLVAANAMDRKPFHTITIEIAGNFEEVDGEGTWWKPEKMGRGRASNAQIEATLQEIDTIIAEVSELGGEVVIIMPHRVSGRNKRGKPNRPLCCGSRVWSLVGERAARNHDLAVPAKGWSIGGTPIPESWHGPHWRGGEGLKVLTSRKGRIERLPAVAAA